MEEEFQEVINMIFQEFYQQALAAEINITGQDQETGGFYVLNAAGETMLVRLDNLLNYYWETRDENAVADFVAKIKAMTLPEEDPAWEEAKDNIFISLYPNDSEVRSPYAKDVTGYFNRFYVLDTPTRQIWILTELADKWGVAEEKLEEQAMKNGERLLSTVSLEIGDVEGHPLGSFRVEDRNLTAACLFAPGIKAKVSKDFGWPIYAVFPDKITCYFFGKDHFAYFNERIGGLVAEKYASSRKVTPELLEFSDQGIKPLCSWTNQGGYVVRFEEE